MVDIKFIRENPEKIRLGAVSKNVEIDVSKILELDEKFRDLNIEVQNLRAERNQAAKDRNIERGREIKAKLDGLETELSSLEIELNELILQIPAIPKDDVKVGKNDSENDVIKTVGEIPQFSFKPKDHLELGELLDIIDVERATKVSGARFAYLKNEGALLEIALVRFAMDKLVQKGFIPIIPPTIISKDSMRALGYMENGGEEDMFQLVDEDKVMVGTAEQSIVPMHKDETLDFKKLPLRYVGYSSSFRKEAGSYGKDTRGILRVHEFHKVEMVSFVANGKDDDEHEFLRSIEEEFFTELGISYQVIKMCTGDLGFPAIRKYDIEAFIPTQEKYREVTSTSTTGDFQARRLNIKYKEEDEKKLVNILNGTAFAIGRTLVTILENYQQEDGSVVIPEVLRKYTGFDRISPKL
ncbi:MAG: serine--tRNA ligase [Candidatus Levybacteria bacterium]|nr:serine--tRNA ligase [Candidatus Levybacteria bacterium]